MTIKPEAFEQLKAAVGEENASRSRVVLESYATNWCVEIINSADAGGVGSQFSHVPAAVVLPGSTEEVVAVVKVCREHGLKFKAQSTGFGAWNQPSSEDVVILDLRRMNRIVEIDPVNMLAVLEPYVTGAQLQSELMRQGLTCHMPGAGPQVSPLASHTSMAGPGFTSPATSHSSRNVLGVEWVLPTGEVLYLGSRGLKDPAHARWFTADGPGPSLRGIMRGLMGAKSGNGIFTKVAIKLYPYPCATTWNLRGTAPRYEFQLPDFTQLHVVDYPTLERMEEGLYRIEEEEVCFMTTHTSTFGLAVIFSHGIWALVKKTLAVLFRRVKHPLVLLVAARTRREFEYKEKVLRHVVEETGGRDLTATGKFKVPSLAYAESLRPMLGFHAFIIGTTFQSVLGGMDTFTMCRKMIRDNVPLKRKYIKRKVIANDGGDGVWATSYEHGHFFHAEMPTMYDQGERRSCEGMVEYLEASNQLALANRLGLPFFIEGDEAHDWAGPQCSNYHLWLRRFKKLLDPDETADSGFYISAKERPS
ncbi:MAG: hypothetical protein Kow0069_14230 [Promethearchaeota archaeon]